VILVSGLVFDDENERKFRAHGVTVPEVQEVLLVAPEFYENLAGRRAPYVMLGPTLSDRLLLVPLEPSNGTLWRPVTAYHPRPQQAARYRSDE